MKYLFYIFILLFFNSCQKESLSVDGRYYPNEYRSEFDISSNSILSLSSNTVKSGDQIQVNLQAYDNSNNLMTTQGVVNFFTEGTASGIFSQVVFDGNGNYSSTFTAVKTGSLIVKAKVNPYKKSIIVGSESLIVTIGDISLTKSTITFNKTLIQVNEPLTFTLTIKDNSGNNIDNGDLQINPTLLDGTSEGYFSSLTYLGNGQYQGTLTGTVQGSPTHINLSIRRQGSIYSSQTFQVY